MHPQLTQHAAHNSAHAVRLADTLPLPHMTAMAVDVGCATLSQRAIEV
jgi:hypothetical protein